jgi:hypothetical protein
MHEFHFVPRRVRERRAVQYDVSANVAHRESSRRLPHESEPKAATVQSEPSVVERAAAGINTRRIAEAAAGAAEPGRESQDGRRLGITAALVAVAMTAAVYGVTRLTEPELATITPTPPMASDWSADTYSATALAAAAVKGPALAVKAAGDASQDTAPHVEPAPAPASSNNPYAESRASSSAEGFEAASGRIATAGEPGAASDNPY